VQRRVRQRRLGLHAGGAQHPKVATLTGRPRGQVGQQGRLANARLAQHNQNGACSGARLFHQGGKLPKFELAAV
jgi:hypothetical protein